eukprot:TRINITY_DN11845_c0_g1_i2.p1 TRINITY_DN11845_c0_g1~~TRINITY_DN11845_c0_g1_i2.p1  ORF type:complete len:962 (+),score=129.73 TRINITY_DN11845_c0_g1_i2:45-2888(+)
MEPRRFPQLLWLLAVLPCAVGSGCGRSIPADLILGKTHLQKSVFAKLERTWLIHVPSNYKIDTPVSLVVALHGWTRNASNYETESGLTIMSEKHGFIVAYPNGMADNHHPGGPWGSWNVAGTTLSPGPAGPTCAPWADAPEFCYDSCKCDDRPQCKWTTCANDVTPSGVGENGEMGFLPGLFDYLVANFCIDSRRQYATGCSNGAMATYQLGVTIGSRLAAIAPVAGSFPLGYLQSPSVPVPVMDVHGFGDDVVPANISMSANGYYYTLNSDIFEVWRRANGCKFDMDRHDSHWPTSLDGTRDLYCVSEGRDCKAAVVRCAYEGGHGSFADGGEQNGELVWGFLSQFAKEESPAQVSSWRVEAPEEHGLDSILLQEAAQAVAQQVPERDCLLVVKDGAIVYETYYGGSHDARHEADSLAKTAVALVVGAAIHAGFFELDVPLFEYGVAPSCDDADCWQLVGCPTGFSCPNASDGFFRNITARTLLAQASGCEDGIGCHAFPGTAFTYDSGQYIQHLTALIRQTTKQAPLQWASKFMEKLGLPDFYKYDDMDDDFSAGGGQFMSCRESARIAQLMLNEGIWPGHGRLVGADFIQEMLKPQFPERGFSYGLLTWLNHQPEPGSPPCCAARWGPPSTCSGKLLSTSLLDVGPHDMGLGIGWLGKYMFVVPSQNLSVVSFGSTWGSSLQCPLGHTIASEPLYNDGYDDDFTAGTLWRSLSKALAQKPHRARNLITRQMTDMPENKQIDDEYSEKPQSEPLQLTSQKGSCSCLCPPGRGFGFCYNGVGDCESVLQMASQDCPAMGVVRQCHSPAVAGDTNCSAMDFSIRGDVGNPKVWGGHMDCSLVTGCSGEAPSATCQCEPKLYGKYGCTWSSKPCKYSPYNAPGTSMDAPVYPHKDGLLFLAQPQAMMSAFSVVLGFILAIALVSSLMARVQRTRYDHLQEPLISVVCP